MNSMTKYGLVLVCLMATACSKQENAPTTKTAPSPTASAAPSSNVQIDVGKFADGVYTNKYFKLKVTMPKDWHALSDAQRMQMMKVGANMLAKGDKRMMSMLKASEVRTLNLFSFFQHKIGARVKFNPSLLGVAENIAFAPGVTDGKAYLQHAKALLQRANMPFKVKDGFTKKSIGAKEFDVMEVHAHVKGMDITQKYMAYVDRGFAVAFVISYLDDQQKAALENALKAVEFH